MMPLHIPLFELPERVPIKLSEHYSTKDYRLDWGERAKYVSLASHNNVRKFVGCDECHMLWFEQGITPVRAAKNRRKIFAGVSIRLCSEHRNQWRERDRRDSGETTWFDPVYVDRVVRVFLGESTLPITRAATDTERLAITGWLLSHGYLQADVERLFGCDSRKVKRIVEQAKALIDK
jgi:hypothetical protein